MTPKIYVSCLAAKNNDWEHGEWIDANQEVEAIEAEIAHMLASSPVWNAQEYEISDYDNFAGLVIKKHPCLSEVSAWAGFIAEHGALGAALIEHTGRDRDESARLLEEYYEGAYESETDFAREFSQWTGEVLPEHLQCYMDYEALARDLFISYFFSVNVGRTVHVFCT